MNKIVLAGITVFLIVLYLVLFTISFNYVLPYLIGCPKVNIIHVIALHITLTPLAVIMGNKK
jgi:hypothetical protein